MTVSLNYQNNEIVSSPTIILSGKSSTGINQGVVQIINNDNKVFPPQYFEVNQGNFKALVHISPAERNQLKIEFIDNGHLNPFGFVEYSNGNPNVVDRSEVSISFNPLAQNKPVHLCVLIGKDSNGTYDMPGYRLQRGEPCNLDTAIRKLKIAGRLMQSYTHEEMRAVGMSNRTFQFVEETSAHQGLFGYKVESPTPHQEVKVHVLRSPKTVSELRDPNLAQQNSKGSNKGGLFSHALEVIKNTPELYDNFKRSKTAIQCAVLYLDTHYDPKQDLILTHAALGGGNADIKLAIFGSHGLHSWPVNFPQVTPSFLDGTYLSNREVANDCNQCGTSWECLNITLGAFMHEIGHLLGCPHQVDGVMLRDYIWWNRSFMTREVECLRTKTKGNAIGQNGIWPKVCHWNRLDLIRFFYHDSFSLPIDSRDPTFGKVQSTTLIPDNTYEDSNKAPTSYNTPHGALVKSESGIFLIEFVTKDLARHSISFYPKTYGGYGLQHENLLDFESCYQALKQNSKDADEHFDVRILSLGGDLFIKDFKKHCSNENSDNLIKGDFGLNRGTISAYKSALLGKSKDKKQSVIGFPIKQVYKVRVYHGGALDGVRFYFNSPGPNDTKDSPKLPMRNYLSKLATKIPNSSNNLSSSESSSGVVTIGNDKSNYSEYNINPGEYITKFHVRNGAWVDAIQVETNTGKKSPMFGNANGGHLSTLEAPNEGFDIVGMYGFVGSWLDGLGILYTSG